MTYKNMTCSSLTNMWHIHRLQNYDMFIAYKNMTCSSLTNISHTYELQHLRNLQALQNLRLLVDATLHELQNLGLHMRCKAMATIRRISWTKAFVNACTDKKCDTPVAVMFPRYIKLAPFGLILWTDPRCFESHTTVIPIGSTTPPFFILTCGAPIFVGMGSALRRIGVYVAGRKQWAWQFDFRPVWRAMVLSSFPKAIYGC